MLNEASSDVIQALNSLIESQNKQSEYVIGYEHTYKEGSLSKDRLHKGMLVKEILLPVDNKLKFAYERIKNNYKININSYNRQFTKLLKERYEYYGDKKVNYTEYISAEKKNWNPKTSNDDSVLPLFVE